MLSKLDVVKKILQGRPNKIKQISASAFAPSNIALCKYWGKRNEILNLPVTGSLSISLGDLGSLTKLSLAENNRDSIILNGNFVAQETEFAQKLFAYLNLFRSQDHFEVEIKTNLPIAAGLASSASGFAALILALNNFYNWELTEQQLSILARLGSGSASRSIGSGFIEWQCGVDEDGMDSYAHKLSQIWPDFRLGLLLIDQSKKIISSRDAMRNTILTSPLYAEWPERVNSDLPQLRQAIEDFNFTKLGEIAEQNSRAMHATMELAAPPIIYSTARTRELIKEVERCRFRDGIEVYYTQDAGPNLKLLFLAKDELAIQKKFPQVKIVRPFHAE